MQPSVWNQFTTKFYAEIVQAWGVIKKRVHPEIDEIIN